MVSSKRRQALGRTPSRKWASHRDIAEAIGRAFNLPVVSIAPDDVERATGLSGAWLEVLLRLHRTPGGALRINEIAEQVTLPASSFSRLADRMEEDDLVERYPDPRHRRATLLHLTPAGEQRFAEAWRALEPSQQAPIGTLLSRDELDFLEKISRKVRDANQPPSVRSGGIADSASRRALRTRPASCETLKALKALYILFFLIKLKTLEAI